MQCQFAGFGMSRLKVLTWIYFCKALADEPKGQKVLPNASKKACGLESATR
jgi:hypothetical protein